MAIDSFKLDQLFMLLVPELVVVGAVMIPPSEPDFVQDFLSIKSNFVACVTSPLMMNPRP
jgi:hypothetical protein